jgi:hypothetical protein
MTPDERKYFDMMEDLFAHPGWKFLSEQFKKEIYQLQADSLDVKVVPNWDVLNFNRGRAVEKAELIRLPEIVAVEKQAVVDVED